MKENISSEIQMFYQWQRPWELRHLAMESARSMSDEAFLSRGGDCEQKIQEALVAATFAWSFHHVISPVTVRMAKIHEKVLDAELQSDSGIAYPFEITTAYPPDYKMRLAYRDGKRPEISRRTFSGEPIPAEWIARAIINKTNKVWNKGLDRHLLVYQNISGGSTNLKRLRQLISSCESVWQSIWLIAGVPFGYGLVLLSNANGFSCSKREWIRNDKWVPIT